MKLAERGRKKRGEMGGGRGRAKTGVPDNFCRQATLQYNPNARKSAYSQYLALDITESAHAGSTQTLLNPSTLRHPGPLPDVAPLWRLYARCDDLGLALPTSRVHVLRFCSASAVYGLLIGLQVL